LNILPKDIFASLQVAFSNLQLTWNAITVE
jgi:hypothetical protein